MLPRGAYTRIETLLTTASDTLATLCARRLFEVHAASRAVLVAPTLEATLALLLLRVAAADWAAAAALAPSCASDAPLGAEAGRSKSAGVAHRECLSSCLSVTVAQNPRARRRGRGALAADWRRAHARRRRAVTQRGRGRGAAATVARDACEPRVDGVCVGGADARVGGGAAAAAAAGRARERARAVRRGARALRRGVPARRRRRGVGGAEWTIYTHTSLSLTPGLP